MTMSVNLYGSIWMGLRLPWHILPFEAWWFPKKAALRKSSATESEPLKSAFDDDARLLADS